MSKNFSYHRFIFFFGFFGIASLLTGQETFKPPVVGEFSMYVNKSVPHDDYSEGRHGFGLEVHRNFFDKCRVNLLVGVEYNMLTQYYRYIHFGGSSARYQTIQVSYFGYATSVRFNTKIVAFDIGYSIEGGFKNSPIDIYPGGISKRPRFGFLNGIRGALAFKIPSEGNRILMKIGYKYNTNSVTGKNFESHSSTVKVGFAYMMRGKPRPIKP